MNGNIKKQKTFLIILGIATIVVALIGATFAYWSWETTSGQRTAISFTVGDGFSCSADGGGNITSSDVQLMPTVCTDTAHAIKRTVKINTQQETGKKVYLDMNLKVNSISTNLANSENFKYSITTGSINCTDGVVRSGNFVGATTDTEKLLIDDKEYATTTSNDTYYLWIWLDKAETNNNTQNQTFNLSLSGSCTDQVPSNVCPNSNSAISINNSTPSAPVLDSSMVPVVIADNGTVTTVSSSDTSWYDYANKKWANAVLVKETGVKTRTENKVAGTVINPSDILAYYVWIPRYKYAIPEALTCGCIPDVNETDYPNCYSISISNEDRELLKTFIINEGMDSESADLCIANEGDWMGCLLYYVSEYNNSNDTDINSPIELQSDKAINLPRTIDIVFESAASTKSTGTATGISYYTHPAFTFGTTELEGIWVGKFKMSHDTLSTSTTSNNLGCTSEMCTNAAGLRVLPNVKSLRYNNVSNMFYSLRSMEQSNNVFGLSSSDSHMMKNSEWGAVAYLSHSNYGLNYKIRINNNDGYTTGCGANTDGGEPSSSCEIRYGDSANYPQSTTGNISGIFDMSGGSWEYVMGNYNGTTGSSGFSAMPNAKYYDNYPSSVFTGNASTNMTFCTLETCGGHALYETKNWYNDYSSFVYSSYPFFMRGGSYGDGAREGGFLSDGSGGGSSIEVSFRVVLAAR